MFYPAFSLLIADHSFPVQKVSLGFISFATVAVHPV